MGFEVVTDEVDSESTDEETTEETTETEEEETPEVEILGEEDDDDFEETDTEDEKEEEEEPEIKADSDVDNIKKDLDETKKALEDSKKEINRLGFKLRKKEKDEPKEKEEGTDFTDAQLLGLMREHKDDPDVLFQVMRQMTKQEVSGVEERAVDSAEIAQVKQNLSSFLDKNFPDIRDEGSELRKNTDDAIEKFNLNDHPYGEFLAIGAFLFAQLPDMIENAKKEGKAEALKAKAEKTRKKSIKDSSLSAKGKDNKKPAQLPKDYKEVTDKLGMSERQKKIYAKLRKSSGSQLTVGA